MSHGKGKEKKKNESKSKSKNTKKFPPHNTTTKEGEGREGEKNEG